VKAERLARATILILILTLASRGLGFLRDAIIAWAFGATAATDAYMVAYTLPYFLQSVLGVALVTVMVPIVSRYLVEERRQEAWSVTSSVVNFMALFFAAAAAAGALAAGPLVRALAPGFAPQQAELAAELTRIMFPSLVFVGVGMLLSGVLNAGWHFGLPALAPGVANAVMILAVLCFGSRYFIYALAWGTLAGFIAFFWVQWPGLKKLGFRYRWRWELGHPEVRRVLAQVPGVVFALSVNQIYLAINRFVASGLAPGSITALDLAFRVLNLPLAIFATSLSTALFPALSRQAARSDLEGLGQATMKGLSGLMVLMIPLSLGLALLHQPIVRLIFQRGVFGASGTALHPGQLRPGRGHDPGPGRPGLGGAGRGTKRPLIPRPGPRGIGAGQFSGRHRQRGADFLRPFPAAAGAATRNGAGHLRPNPAGQPSRCGAGGAVT
jgi:putative peptidoglycan lipid II flippase